MEWQSVELREQGTHVQAPVGVQVVEHPMEAVVSGELCGDVSQVCCEIDAGARDAQIPHDLAGRHHEGRDQGARAVANVFVFAFFGFAWFGCDRGMLALEDLHAGFFIAADDQFSLLIQHGSLHVESADRVRFAVEVWIVTVEPINAAMGFEVRFVEDAPDGGTRHRLVRVTIDQDGRQVVDAPVTGDAIMRAGLAGGDGDDFELFVGGKSSGADRSEARPAAQRDAAVQNEYATG